MYVFFMFLNLGGDFNTIAQDSNPWGPVQLG